MTKKVVVRHPVASEIKGDVITQKQGKPIRFEGEPALVRVSMGSTLNMGNYQSLRVGVDLSLPCREQDIEKAFDKARSFVEKKLGIMIDENTKTEQNDEAIV